MSVVKILVELVLISTWSTLKTLGECNINQGQLLDVLYRRTESYTVSFDIKPLSVQPSWSNILHFTIGDNRGSFGDRAPAVWFMKNSTVLYICSDFYSSLNKCSKSKPLVIGRYHRLIIKQRDVGLRYSIYSAFLDGKHVHHWANFTPRCFRGVKVYMSNPWYKAALATIKNFKYTNDKTEPVIYCP
uniref:Cnidarian restricted protein n=1 Tax=Clytia hemisphaerica TaxID=252671 RepID=A0A7M5UK69_9CNID